MDFFFLNRIRYLISDVLSTVVVVVVFLETFSGLMLSLTKNFQEQN